MTYCTSVQASEMKIYIKNKMNENENEKTEETKRKKKTMY